MNLRGKKENMNPLHELGNVKRGFHTRKHKIDKPKDVLKCLENNAPVKNAPLLRKPTNVLNENENINPLKLKRTCQKNDVSKVVAKSSKNNAAVKSESCTIAGSLNRKKQVKGLLHNEDKKRLSKIPKDYFGFNSDESDIEHESCNVSLTQFDPTKPFRLALYVHPSKRPRIDPLLLKTNPALCSTLNNTNLSSTNNTRRPVARSTKKVEMAPNAEVAVEQTFSNLSSISPIRPTFKMPLSSTPLEKKNVKLVQQKITSVFKQCPKKSNDANKNYTSFFEDTKDCASKETSNEEKENIEDQTQNIENESLFLPQANRRRSYVKRKRNIEVPQAECSSDVILKSLEKSKKKGKTRKNKKEDEEFEKWSRSVNSEFDEVEKFEVSFT